jgi:hypothetical protein
MKEIKIYIKKAKNSGYIINIPQKDKSSGLNFMQKEEYEDFVFKNEEELTTWLKEKLKELQ